MKGNWQLRGLPGRDRFGGWIGSWVGGVGSRRQEFRDGGGLGGAGRLGAKTRFYRTSDKIHYVNLHPPRMLIQALDRTESALFLYSRLLLVLTWECPIRSDRSAACSFAATRKLPLSTTHRNLPSLYRRLLLGRASGRLAPAGVSCRARCGFRRGSAPGRESDRTSRLLPDGIAVGAGRTCPERGT